MKLFVGLGNPGAKYERNRHNVGFMALERIADRHRFGPWRRRFQGTTSEGEIGGERIVLLKPETYMNESGRAIGEAARFLKIDPADVVVFHDELDLLPGKVKVKLGGGNAGHNGLRSASAHIGNEYVRVRIGIGHPGHKDAVASYVLHDFAKADATWLDALLDALSDAAPHLAKGDDARFLTEVARAIEPETDKPGKAKVAPDTDRVGRAGPAKRSSPAPHPAGERAGKRQGAVAENLRKWLAARGEKDKE